MLYKLENIIQKYGKHIALDLNRRNGQSNNTSPLVITKGSVLALTGPNGAGKSTLLRLLAFLEKPSQGTIQFYGTPRTAPRLEATLLLQEPYVFKRSVLENVCYGLRLRRDTQHMEERALDALARVGFSTDQVRKRPWYQLSGGEKQRVALAARLVLNPLALLLDEPTAHVDGKCASAIHEAVHRAAQEDTTVIVSSHDRAWLQELNAEYLSLEAQDNETLLRKY